MSTFVTHIIEKETTGEEAPRKIVLEEALEAILFAAGHEISYATLARVFDITPHKAKEYVMAYAEVYNHSETPRGVELLTFPDSCQLATKQHFLSEIRDTLGLKRTGTISTSSMEALAIIAYNQPVTRVFVDTLRRADSSYAMNNLLDRGLIECKGRLDVPGRPMLYGTTSDFLRCFGLHDLTELPQTTEELNAMFQKAQSEPAPEENIEGGEQLNLFDDTEDGATISSNNDTRENADEAENATVSEESSREDFDEGPSADDDIQLDAEGDISSDFDASDEEQEDASSDSDVSDEEQEDASSDSQPDEADQEEFDLPFPDIE